MEHLVDLDELASRLGSIVQEWREQVTVGPMTWRDGAALWPQPIVTDRTAVEVPESLGMRLSRDPDDEMEIVVWSGGWADVATLKDGEEVNRCPEFRSAETAYAVIVADVNAFLVDRDSGSDARRHRGER